MTTIHAHYAPGFTIMQFNGPDNEIGRVWQEGGKLHFEGNATDAARQLFEQVVKRNNDFMMALQEQNNDLHKQLLEMEHDRDKWKNHHNTEVARARVLKTRTDLPVERKMLYEALRLAEIAAGTATADEAEYVVTSPEALDKVLDVYHAAERLVRCKGRYHSEQNYKALAQLFDVTVPDLPPTDADLGELTAVDTVPAFLTAISPLETITVSQTSWEKIQQLLNEPPAPSEGLIKLMTRKPRYHIEITAPKDGK